VSNILTIYAEDNDIKTVNESFYNFHYGREMYNDQTTHYVVNEPGPKYTQSIKFNKNLSYREFGSQYPYPTRVPEFTITLVFKASDFSNSRYGKRLFDFNNSLWNINFSPKLIFENNKANLVIDTDNALLADRSEITTIGEILEDTWYTLVISANRRKIFFSLNGEVKVNKKHYDPIVYRNKGQIIRDRPMFRLGANDYSESNLYINYFQFDDEAIQQIDHVSDAIFRVYGQKTGIKTESMVTWSYENSINPVISRDVGPRRVLSMKKMHNINNMMPTYILDNDISLKEFAINISAMMIQSALSTRYETDPDIDHEILKIIFSI